jgi:hypothetical protein
MSLFFQSDRYRNLLFFQLEFRAITETMFNSSVFVYLKTLTCSLAGKEKQTKQKRK